MPHWPSLALTRDTSASFVLYLPSHLLHFTCVFLAFSSLRCSLVYLSYFPKQLSALTRLSIAIAQRQLPPSPYTCLPTTLHYICHSLDTTNCRYSLQKRHKVKEKPWEAYTSTVTDLQLPPRHFHLHPFLWLHVSPVFSHYLTAFYLLFSICQSNAPHSFHL